VSLGRQRLSLGLDFEFERQRAHLLPLSGVAPRGDKGSSNLCRPGGVVSLFLERAAKARDELCERRHLSSFVQH
jgi:hypothetical protein